MRVLVINVTETLCERLKIAEERGEKVSEHDRDV